MRGVRQTNQFDVRSADGTPIAVWVSGSGPALVLVHGSISNHDTFAELVDALGGTLTTYAIDRRGFGQSGDRPEHYALEREFEDIAAVVDSIAAHGGGPVTLFGHSYGAGCCIGAAALTRSIARLILYEPGLGLRYPDGVIAKVEAALASGDHEGALILVLVDIVGLDDGDIAALRASPMWSARVASASTLPREARVEDRWVYRPGQFAPVTAPVLLLSGSETEGALREATREAAAALGNARIHVMDGHGHLAHKSAPKLLAGLIHEFMQAA